jgi:hypothetical protein
MRWSSPWSLPRLLLLAAAYLLAGGTLSAQVPAGPASVTEKGLAEPHDTADLYGSLRDVINYGAELFNKQADHAGCYRVYQGALIGIRPYISAELRKKVDDSITRAEGLPYYSERAFELRRTLDDIRSKAGPSKGATPVIANPSAGPGNFNPNPPRVESPTRVDPPKVDLPKIVETPKVEVPKVEVPKVTVPKVEAPRVEPPKIDLPPVKPPMQEPKKVDPPKVELPKVELPKVEAPKVDLPKIELPKVDAPKGDEKKSDPPKIELPKVEPPKLPSLDLPKIEDKKPDLPKVEPPKVDLPKVELPKVEAPKVDLPKIELPKIETPSANPSKDPPPADPKEKKVEPAKYELPKIELPTPSGPPPVDLPAAGGKDKKDKGEVAGTVVFDGKPLPAGHFVTLVSAEGKRFSAPVQKGGVFRFALGLPIGSYRVVVEPGPGDAGTGAIVPARYRDEKMSGLVLQVNPGTVTPELRLMP